MFTATWSNPASDIDLYAVEVTKDGSANTLGQCALTGTTSEKVYLGPADLRPGKHYALVMQFFRSLNETATGTVEMGIPSTIKHTADLPGLGDPANADCVF